ncbi:MAG: hypothetical protein JWO05_1368 [Gemmatimonadetes bacterium]|nr:hypothetical protein [Gemmatimonadota bacterium]
MSLGISYTLSDCPACGATDAVEIAGPDAMRREVEELWEFHQRRLDGSTPVERLLDRVAFSQHAPLRMVRCARCGAVFRNPTESDAELRDAYVAEPPSGDVLRALHETQRPAYRAQATRLREVLGRTGSVLEVGSYAGAFLAEAHAAGWQAEGVDVSTAANEVTREMGFTAHDGTVEQLRRAEPHRRWDAVAIWNTFDQLPDQRAAAHAAGAMLRDGGVLALRVPNGAFYAAVRSHLHGPLAKAARLLLAHNNLLAFPYRVGFTPAALRHLLEPLGFTVERVHGDVLVPIADEYTHRWAGIEERVVKSLLALVANAAPDDEIVTAPWFELYARKGAGSRRPTSPSH